MSESSLTISFLDTYESVSTDRVFVHLEQKDHNEQQETVNMYDIQQMVARAKSGISARTYKSPGCPAYIDGDSIVMDFDFYAWPSDPNLIYTITSGLGNVTDPQIIQKQVQFSVTFEMSDIYEFDFILEDITSIDWETECYDSDGRVVEDVTVEMDGYTTLRASAVIFGVIRITGTKRGALHTLTSRLVKTQAEPPSEQEFNDSGAGRYATYYDFMGMYWPASNIDSWEDVYGNDQPVVEEQVNYTGLKLTNLKVSVTAHWFDGGEEKTSSIILEAPQCIKDLLTACGVDTDGDGIPDDWSDLEDILLNGMCLNPENTNPWNVYVSSCTGKTLLAVQEEMDENAWCGNG